VTFSNERAVEAEDLGHQSALLVSVVDDQSVEADVEPENFEVQVWDAADAFAPVVP
jgi:hypothetical protein